MNDLERLEAAAAAVDQDAAADMPAPEVPQEPPGDPGDAIRGVLTVARDVLAPMFPSLHQVYTPEVIDQVAVVTVPVCKKYGWSLDSERWPELTAAAVLLPLGVATYRGIAHDLEARASANDDDKGRAEADGET